MDVAATTVPALVRTVSVPVSRWKANDTFSLNPPYRLTPLTMATAPVKVSPAKHTLLPWSRAVVMAWAIVFTGAERIPLLVSSPSAATKTHWCRTPSEPSQFSSRNSGSIGSSLGGFVGVHPGTGTYPLSTGPVSALPSPLASLPPSEPTAASAVAPSMVVVTSSDAASEPPALSPPELAHATSVAEATYTA
jgi:hypothetical protein